MYKISQCANGVRVITHKMKERDSISIGLLVDVGGRYETRALKGAAHFLEHILFKGSANYSCEAIKESIEGVGGTLNAFTSEEQTCFYAKIPSAHFAQTFDVLSDMVFHPKINAKDVAKEKTVIAEEIKMYHDLSQYYVMELLDGLLWPDHPLGQGLAGTVESVAQLSARDLKQFHRTHYNSQNIVISACGNVDHEKIIRLVKSKIKGLKQGQATICEPANNVQEQARVHFFKRDIEQMHVAIGMLGYDEHHVDRYVLSLLGVLLGGNMSSRLFVEVREKKGLAYSIAASAKSYRDTGMFVIRAGVDNKNLIEAVSTILKELIKIQRYSVSVGEFKRAKDYILGQLVLGLEDTMEHMLWAGEAVVSKNKVDSMKTIINKFEKITPDDVKRVAREIFHVSRINCAVVGPLSDVHKKGLSSLLGV